MTDSGLHVSVPQRSSHHRSRAGVRWGWRGAIGAVVCALILAACSRNTATTTLRPAQAAGASAQRATRAELTAKLADLDRQIATGGSKKGKLQAEAAAVRMRLDQGDFHSGDRFLITITQDAASRSDTASVRDSLMVSIVGLPDLTLKGTLRSELNERLSAHVARFLRNSTVRSVVFTRIAIMGAVARPGFFVAPPDRPISELVMLAGGTIVGAVLNDLQVYRAGQLILDKKEMRQAFNDGRTLEELDIQSGDELRIPTKRSINAATVVQVIFFTSSIFFAVVNFLRFYYGQQQP